MKVNARASLLWRDVRNTFNLLSSRKQREDRHWNQPCNFYSVIIPVTTSDRADINSQLSYFFCFLCVFSFASHWLWGLMVIPVHDTEHSQLDLRPVFQKTTCNRFREANLSKNSGLLRFVTGARARQAWMEGALLSISIFISFLVGRRSCVHACCAVSSYTHVPGLPCVRVTHCEKVRASGTWINLFKVSEKPYQDVTVLRTGRNRYVPKNDSL